MSAILHERALWASTPPHPRTRLQDWPTLLYSWWATAFAAVVIITRLVGRKIRSNKLFPEDWIMCLALIPLFARMAFVHMVLIYGTNNVATIDIDYTAEQIRNREFGSKMVLAARIFYAIFIWMSKWTVSEFLKRITIHLWRSSYEFTLHCIRIFLLVTLVGVIIATLAECQPFDHYWQVVPDPGPQCRQNYAQLLTMGSADIITDILLVAFPIPIVLRSGQTWRRKLQTTALFSTSIALIIITGFRMPEVISNLGRQQYRTVWASSEILASAFVSNFVIIGSFIRDKGTKKNKYKSSSVSDSIDRTSTRRPTIAAQSMNSEEDLFRFLGCRMPEHLQDSPESLPRLAPVALPAMSSPFAEKDRNADTSRREPIEGNDGDVSPSHNSGDDLPLPSPSPSTERSPKKKISFFDVGGLLENGSMNPPSPAMSQSRSVTLVSSGTSHTIATDFAPHTPPRSRRGSRAFLSDMGANLTPSTSRGENSAHELTTINGFARRSSLPGSRLRNGPPTGVLGPMLERQETQISLQDAGGLLATSLPMSVPETHNDVRVVGQIPEISDDEDNDEDELLNGRRDGTGRLQDLGSFLAADRRHDVDPSPLSRRTQPSSQTGRGTQVSSAPAAASNTNSDYDSMDIHDAGGLLGR
ncbi:hypothetical protein Q7P37_005600 [Cladosporium fusiforme]